ncbi:MAG TPA: Gfo/Idh/MocA family oxidoreductase [Tepidisphaeraceae bacterium]|jgi:predicted dehydrogenase
MSEGSNRRDFIKYTAATGMGFWVAARKTAAQEATSSKSPNERINIACVGVGGKGQSDSEQASEVGRVVAICDVSDDTLDRRMAYKARDGSYPFLKARRFHDFRKMFDRMGKDFDAVTVSIPDHNHAVVAMMGIKNKKAVYCQKPLAHYVAEARALRLAAEENKVATQMGNQGTAENGLREAVEVVQAGGIGPVKEVHIWTNRPIWPQAPMFLNRPMNVDDVPEELHWDEFIGPGPFRPFVQKAVDSEGKERNNVYQPFNWRGWWDWGTGALGDMGCHTANMPYMALKLYEVHPTTLQAESGIINFETYPSWAHVTFEFPARGEMPPVRVNWYEGHKDGKVVQPPDELKEQVLSEYRKHQTRTDPRHANVKKLADSGCILVGEKGIIYSPNDYGAAYAMLPDAEFANYQKPPQTLPRNGEGDLGMKKEWVAAIKGGPPAMSNFNYSARLSEFILLGNVAIRAGAQHPLQWDGEAMKVTNWPEANAFLKREYRKGYEL